jgi:hypothetical protein
MPCLLEPYFWSTLCNVPVITGVMPCLLEPYFWSTLCNVPVITGVIFTDKQLYCIIQ